MNAASPVLLLDRVAKSFAMPGGGRLDVLRDVSLSVAAGDSIAITGPSGSGKSTLLNLIGALDRPTAGRIVLDTIDLSTQSDDQLAALRNRDIGFVFQLHHLLPHCTALENVLMPALPHARSSVALTDRTAHARDLLGRVGLGDRLDTFAGHLSGGERQRVAVARALINQPRLLLADEPTGSLDQAAAHEISVLLADLTRTGVAIILVTHALDLARSMRRVLALHDGRLEEVRA